MTPKEKLEKSRKYKRDYMKEWRKRNPDKVMAGREKAIIRVRKWREENPEKDRLRWQSWVANNPEKVKARIKRFFEKHPEKSKEYYLNYTTKNPDKVKSNAKTRAKKWRTTNPDNFKESLRTYRKKNPELIAIHKAKRRARKLESLGDFSLEDWKDIKKKYKYICPSCGQKEPDIKLTMDHIVPLIKGGKHDKSNIQPLCNTCNNRKYIQIRKWNPDGQMEIVI